MKRSNTNRQRSLDLSGSVTLVETLEPRQLFCYAPLGTPAFMEQAIAENPVEARNWPGIAGAEQTSGSTGATGSGNVK